MKRQLKIVAVIAAAGLLAAGCGDDDSTSSGGGDGGGGEKLTLGAPQDCEENAFCIPGLKDTYGVDFTDSFTPLDLDLIPTSLEQDAIDVGVFLSTSGKLTDDKFTVLEDDKGMLAADNVFPVASKELETAYGDDLATVLNDVSGKLDTDALIGMNKRYEVDHDDAADIAKDWLADNDLAGDESATPKDGPAVKIGAQDFGESAILAEVYKQALTGAGFNASTVEVGGFRDLLFAAFQSGDVNLAPDYVSSELDFLEEGSASSDVTESLDKLKPLLEAKNLVAYDASDAVDTNTFVMTTDRADELGIKTLSDLADKVNG
ncbi:MAG TPA: glycine betaine ABC transporter substrate-binding protein [Acidimicrobiales bacterium]|jgi:osmoprotectant transport system substrate-binding protein